MTARPDPSGRRRAVVHPAAWWVWATALAVAVSNTTNPVVLVLVISVVVLTVAARRPDAPWSRSLRLYLGLGAFIVTSRVVLHILVGIKTSDHVVLPLPAIALPHWAQGISLLGPVGLGGLVGAGLEGLRLATMLLCFGAANALANPRRLLAATPAAVKDIATAVVITLSVAPQLVESVHRVRRARVLRGDARRAARVRQVALPVLHDTLDRSIALAASMDARGYGTRRPVSLRTRWVTGALGLGGPLLVCLGVYGTMQSSGPGTTARSGPWWTSWPVLLLGIAASVVGLVLAGRAARRTRYRPDRWGDVEWAVVACGVLCLAAIRAVFFAHSDARVTPVSPLALPAVPVTLPLAVLPAFAPAFFTPEPARSTRAPRLRRRAESDPTEATESSLAPRDARDLRGTLS